MAKVLKYLLLICFTAITLTACGGDTTTPDTSTTDTMQPTVSSSSPATNSTGVAVNTAITATFSETVDASTINTATFDVSGVTGTVTCNGSTATFTPSSNLSSNTTYTATISTGVKDSSGNAMASNYTWTFTTGTMPDTTPPTVSSTSPANNATGVAVSSAITATFSETMDASTINMATFTIDGVIGTVTYNGTTATFMPSSNLAYSTTYTATISAGVKDSSGNTITTIWTWTFTTMGTLDTTFGTAGIVTTDIGGRYDQAYALGIQSDGKIVVAGVSIVEITVLRYNTDGTADTTFGTGGFVTTNMGSSAHIWALSIQTDGRIVVAGMFHNGTDSAISG